MPAAVVVVGLTLLAALAVAAARAPAPCVSDSTWQGARGLVLPVALLWMVSLTVCQRPSAFAVAMVSGTACCAVGWVLRAPPPPPPPGEDERRGRGGGEGDDPPDGPSPGGDGIDWDAFERAAFDAFRHREGGAATSPPSLPRP